MESSRNSIIFVPGIRPKPPPDQHRAALWECLVEGVRRANPAVARALQSEGDCFQLVSWNRQFYGMDRDIEADRSGIREVLEQTMPTEQDLEESRAFGRRLNSLIYAIGDRFPVLRSVIANRQMETRLSEVRRYFRNRDGAGEQIRAQVGQFLERAWANGERVMLIGHSFGSVIAYDTLWDISRMQGRPGTVDLFLTMGSPLGLHFMRRRVKGANRSGVERFPSNIRRWLNVTAVGEAAALDRKFVECYRDMLELGLVESITDHMELVNFFRGPDGLNVHKCYGYFASRDTGNFIAEWWPEDQ